MWGRQTWETMLCRLPLAILLLGVAGCGGVGDVAGAITLDGTPIPAGSITFVNDKSQSASGGIENGRYKVKKVPLGTLKVVVFSRPTPPLSRMGAVKSEGPETFIMPDPEAVKAQLAKNKANQGATPAPKLARKDYLPIPDHYGSPEQTPLTFTVHRGVQTIDIELHR